jgi:hypothetical protein
LEQTHDAQDEEYDALPPVRSSLAQKLTAVKVGALAGTDERWEGSLDQAGQAAAAMVGD